MQNGIRTFEQRRKQYKESPKKSLLLANEELEAAKKQIIDFLKRKAKKVVIGLSGGLDSALTACLAVEALGKENVFALLLPSETSEKIDKEYAEEISKQLGINYEIIDIQPAVEQFSKTKFFGEKLPRENLISRIRMVYLFGKANSINGVVLGTGNLSEIKIGYFTKYGDSASDITPIADLYKTQAKQLAKLMNLPEKIIERKPTAGLSPGQTDEQDIGLDYEKLDMILLGQELGFTTEEISELAGIEKNKIEKINRMQRKSEHKRRMPIYPKFEYSKTTALFIGRFQPLHKAHQRIIQEILKTCNKLIIAVGSSQKSYTKINPFTKEERRKMIEKSINGSYEIVYIPDIENNEEWVEFIQSLIPHFNIVYTKNPLTKTLFERAGYKVEEVEKIGEISSTEVRDRIAEDKNWEELVPEGTIEVLKEIKGIERIKELNC